MPVQNYWRYLFSSRKKVEGQHGPGRKSAKMSSSRDGALQEPALQRAAITSPNSSAPSQATFSSISPLESTDTKVSGEPGSLVGPRLGGSKDRSRELISRLFATLLFRGTHRDSLVVWMWCMETMAGQCLGFSQFKPFYPKEAQEPVLEKKMTVPAGTGQVSPWIQHLLFMFQNKLHYFCSRLIITSACRLSSCPWWGRHPI